MTCLSKFRIAHIKDRCGCCNKPIYTGQQLINSNGGKICYDCIELRNRHFKTRGGHRKGCCYTEGAYFYEEVEEELAGVGSGFGYRLN